ncbi:MAG: 5-formyltetrahydrofolate cyclo-ligase [Clostridia bacterium]|nr:5-formyltetrahydrofolate cyclo-ligase [Clostridia bacterium]
MKYAQMQSNDKAALRVYCLNMRKNLAYKQASWEDFTQIDEFKKADVIFCYVSAFNEVGTHSLIKELLKEKTVVVPKCLNKDGEMICVKLSSFEELEKGMFGIFEPRSSEAFDKKLIDAVIMPGVAFDKSGHRLGFGKGFYDRFLSDISPYKIALSHKELVFDEIPYDEKDVPMDKIIEY